MPDVRMPDGTIIRNVPDGTTKADLEQRYKVQQMRAKTAKHPILGPVLSAVSGFADSMTLGADDEVQATIDTVNPFGSGPNMWNSNFGDAWGKNQRNAQGRKDQLRDTSPVSSVAGSIAGAVAPALVTGGASAATAAPRVASTAPRLVRAGRAAAPAAIQAGTYGFNSGQGGIGSRALNAAKSVPLGIIGDTAGKLVGRTVGRVVGGRKPPLVADKTTGNAVQDAYGEAVDTLKGHDILLSPGMRAGGFGRKLEDAADSLGFVSPTRGAKDTALIDFNRGTYNQVLQPLGIKLNRNVVPGRAALTQVDDTVSAAYDDAASKLSLGLDDDLMAAINEHANGALAKMGPENASQLTANIDNILSWRNRPAPIQGREVSQTLGDLRGVATSARTEGKQALADSLWQIHDELEEAAMAQSPKGAVNQFKKAREASRRMHILDRAGAKTTDGLVTPGQLKTSVHTKGYGVTNNRLARGEAPMQQYSDAAATVLPDRLPDSGTAARSTLMSLATGGSLFGGLGAAGVSAPGAAALAAPAAMYIPAVNRLLQNGRNLAPGRIDAGQAVRRASPSIGAGMSLSALALAYPHLFSDRDK